MFDMMLAWDRAARTGPKPTIHTLRVRIVPRSPAGLGDGLPVMMAIALDTSGSMTGEKLANSKRACEAVLSLLRPQDRLWLAGFSTDLVPVADGIPGGSDAAKSVVAKIERLVAQGVTRTDVALQWIEACLPQTPGSTRVGILVTDGIPTDPLGKQAVDPEPLVQMAGRMGQSGITVCAVGLGSARHYNSALLTQISDRGHGEFLYADDPKTLDQLLLRRLSASQTVAVSEAALEIERLLPGVEVRAACRFRPEYLPLEPLLRDTRFHIELGSVRGDAATDMLLAVDVPAANMEQWEGAAKVLSLELTGAGAGLMPKAVAALTNTLSYSEAQKRDAEVEKDRLNWDVNLYSDALLQVQEQPLPDAARVRKTGHLLGNMEQSARRAGNTDLADEAAAQITDLRRTGKLDNHRATGLLTSSRNLGAGDAGDPVDRPV